MEASRQTGSPGPPLGRNPEGEDIKNPDIRIPVDKNAERPRQRGEEDGENMEAEKGCGEREHEETRRPEQQTSGERRRWARMPRNEKTPSRPWRGVAQAEY
ncbi:hypothetical protein NDU88_004150 [Pleurodeles waltl]|uniref:Uncharacterized protein n=1 Tax=Pleurodeles waltl TaxID=8319 RepID=A0AAV7T7A7_PLEWA|nr:hypothetical protein NDU88_004150 [Pleurodeles waltl]